MLLTTLPGIDKVQSCPIIEDMLDLEFLECTTVCAGQKSCFREYGFWSSSD